MATLTPRHRWMVAQVVSSFDLTEFEPLVESHFRDQFAPKVDPFLKGTSATQHLLFSYRVRSNPSATQSDIPGKLICSGATAAGRNNGNSRRNFKETNAVEEAHTSILSINQTRRGLKMPNISMQSLAFHMSRPPAFRIEGLHPYIGVNRWLCATEGVSEEHGSKHVYFIRTIPFGKSGNLDAAAGAGLFFGALPELPLQGLHSTLASVFLPAVEHFDNTDW